MLRKPEPESEPVKNPQTAPRSREPRVGSQLELEPELVKEINKNGFQEPRAGTEPF